MKNTFGNNFTVSVFGESHGKSIGAFIDGIAPGIEVNEDFIRHQLSLRRPSGKISTARSEADPFEIQSGVFEGKTTGTPICIVIPNGDTKSKDYSEIKDKARPSHADYTAHCKYGGFEDYRGGGHQSGRITAAIVAAAALVIPALNKKGIYIGSHIKKCVGITDADFSDYKAEIADLNNKTFAVIDPSCEEKMQSAIIKAAEHKDSVGGVLETAIIGLPAGVGEPMFDSLESMLSHAMFSVPAVKGVEFGKGFAIADMFGSEANDQLFCENGEIHTKTNNNGGILGGITNGEPVIFRTAIKPTPTIFREQDTINMKTLENTTLISSGRHDPCIVHRARVVVDSMAAITVYDMLATRFGTDWVK